MAISGWPLAERPRERLLAHGAAALSDAELLAIFLRTGIPGKSAIELARELLANLHGLGGYSLALRIYKTLRAWGRPRSPSLPRSWKWRAAA